ncbi:MAG: hypothetical protein AVDCRST_MAG68-4231, partial [uncultured Gemmatimonadetes bacterium]
CGASRTLSNPPRFRPAGGRGLLARPLLRQRGQTLQGDED